MDVVGGFFLILIHKGVKDGILPVPRGEGLRLVVVIVEVSVVGSGFEIQFVVVVEEVDAPDANLMSPTRYDD